MKDIEKKKSLFESGFFVIKTTTEKKYVSILNKVFKTQVKHVKPENDIKIRVDV